MAGVAADRGRLPVLYPRELTEEQSELYSEIAYGKRSADRVNSPLVDARGGLEGPFNAMLFSPPIGQAMQSLGASIRYHTSLSTRQREIAILVVAAVHDSDFEWYAHERLALAAGVPAEVLDAIRANQDLGSGDAPEDVIRKCARALAEHGDLDDIQFEQLKDTAGLPGAVELVSLVGYYSMLALVLRTFRVPTPASSAARDDASNTRPSAFSAADQPNRKAAG